MAEMSHGLFTSTLTHTEHLKNVHFLKNILKKFIYLAVPGLSNLMCDLVP